MKHSLFKILPFSIPPCIIGPVVETIRIHSVISDIQLFAHIQTSYDSFRHLDKDIVTL